MTQQRLSYAPMDSPIGRLWVTVSPRGLVAVSRGELPALDAPVAAMLDRESAAPAMAELAAYFAGHLRAFSLALDLGAAGPFDAAIWQAARRIPYGETVSYAKLAAMAAFPRAARAAGGAMSRCPLSPVVPCHRVINADGSIGGWGGDLWIKRWLLDLEGSHAGAGR